MVRNFSYKFCYLYLFIILINPIYPFILSLEQENDIVFIYPKSKYILYYFTYTDIYLLDNQVKNNLATKLNLTSSSDISILNSLNMTFIITCSNNNLLEIINLNGTLLNKLTYDSFEIELSFFQCPLHYINNISYYGYSDFSTTNTQIQCIYNEINSENNEIRNIKRNFNYITLVIIIFHFTQKKLLNVLIGKEMIL